ncbi:MAG: hypothetical protein FD128_1327 [Hyphomonadaceae bacterium]|nr:MAG: hypothetical protein FD128_1327 [Hyphomonadaceae bacterium]
MSSGRRPLPVSPTSMRQTCLPSKEVSIFSAKSTVPFFVNFTALDNRFETICRIRTESPIKLPLAKGANVAFRTTFFSLALLAKSMQAFSKDSCKLNIEFAISILPDSTRAMSRMSLRIWHKVSPDVSTNFNISFCLSSSAVFVKIPVTAIIPFKGVRISWLILARNSLFTRLRRLASSNAFFNSLRRRTSSVMSVEMVITRPWPCDGFPSEVSANLISRRPSSFERIWCSTITVSPRASASCIAPNTIALSLEGNLSNKVFSLKAKSSPGVMPTISIAPKACNLELVRSLTKTPDLP